MSNNQVKELFIRIKALYPTFSANQDVKNEWNNWLKDYSNDGVNRNLNKWYEEHPNEVPTIINLIDEFIRVNARERLLGCKYCEKTFKEDDLELLQLHEARHRSINYIKKKEHLLKQNYDAEKLMNLDDETFEKDYDKFLEMIYERENDPKEKELLSNCIFGKSNLECEVM